MQQSRYHYKLVYPSELKFLHNELHQDISHYKLRIENQLLIIV
jgi:hypothetical protein